MDIWACDHFNVFPDTSSVAGPAAEHDDLQVRGLLP